MQKNKINISSYKQNQISKYVHIFYSYTVQYDKNKNRVGKSFPENKFQTIEKICLQKIAKIKDIFMD